jgi:MFS family permease
LSVNSSLSLLRVPAFRNLFLGQSASSVGDQVVVVALALYITRRTGSPTDLGFVLAAKALPLIALVLLGGVVADRLPRQRLMLASDGIRAALHALLAALIVAGGASVVELIAIEAAFGAAQAFFQPAYTGLLPRVVPAAQLQQAQALSSTTQNLAIFVGPALGTLLVLGLGAGTAFALDAATFALSAVLLLRVTPRPARAGEGAEDETESLSAALRAGWDTVRALPWVWVTIASFTIGVCVGYAPWYALAPAIAQHVYGGTSRFGVLESVAGGGAVLAAIAGLRWRPRRPLLLGLVLTLFWPAQSLAFAAGAPLAVVIALAFASGAGFSLFEIWWQTALASHIPPQALSRVSSYDWMGSLALLPLGFALSGPVGSLLGDRVVLAGGAAISVVALLGALVPRSTRRLTGAQPRSSRAQST